MAAKKKTTKKKATSATPKKKAVKKSTAKKTTKKAPVKKTKKAAAKKAPAKKNVFGHREGTLTSVMDNLLIAGTTLEDGAAAMAEFKGEGADEKACARQLKTHIKYLQNKKGADVKFMKKAGKYKVAPGTKADEE